MAKKNKVNIVYSTNPDFRFDYESNEEQQTLDPSKQQLKVQLDKKQRAGKAVTLITGFVGTENDLNDLGKMLKSKCGVGGTVKDGEILIQGDHREKIMDILTKAGYKVKRIGG
jgi:translation initiation factor 1